MAVDAGADVLGELALEELRDAGGELHHLEAALDLARGVGEHLAVLGGDEGGELVGALLGDAQEGVEDAGAAQGRRQRPVAGDRLGGGHRRVDVRRAGQRDPAGLLAGGRVEDGGGARAGAGGKPAADEVRNRGGHRGS